jgi:C4-dicarboxylate transporter DctQ subunit
MRLRRDFSRTVDILGAVIFSTITLVASAQIINRYVFNGSFVFAEEMAVQLMIWIAFLGAAKCVSENCHTRLTVVVDMLPRKARCASLLLADLLCVAFLAVAAWYGFRLVGTTWRGTTTGTRIPEGLVYLAMPLCSVVMIGFLLANAIAAARQMLMPDEALPAAPADVAVGEHEP